MNVSEGLHDRSSVAVADRNSDVPENRENRDPVRSVAQEALGTLIGRELSPDEAATALQKAWRGFQVRKKLQVKNLAAFTKNYNVLLSYFQLMLEGAQSHVEQLWKRGILANDQRKQQMQWIHDAGKKYAAIFGFSEDLKRDPLFMDTASVVELGTQKMEGMRSTMKDLVIKTGSSKLTHALHLFLSHDWRGCLSEEGRKRIEDLDGLFHPTGFLVVNASLDANVHGSQTDFTNSEGKWIYDPGEFARKLPIMKRGTFLSSYEPMEILYGGELFLPLPEGKALVVKGYFDKDPTGISQHRGWFAERAKQLGRSLEYIHGVPRVFKENYFHQYSFHDLLIWNEETMEADIRRAYFEWQNFANIPQKALIVQFLSKEFHEQARMVALLLCAEDPHLGYWLWEKVGAHDPKYQELIYEHLHGTLQMLLDSSQKSVEEMRLRLKEKMPTNVPLREQVENSKMPEKVKELCLERLGNGQTSFIGALMGGGGEGKEWVAKLLRHPWGKSGALPIGPESSNDERAKWMAKISQKIDAYVHGQTGAKERIKRVINRISKTDTGGGVILLKGPPGNGKTTFARGIAEALGLPFVQLEGKDDIVNWIGTATNYKDSKPGSLVTMFPGTERFVVLIDELDKFGDAAKAQQCYDRLIQLFDPKQNQSLPIDNYFADVPFDFSKVIFVATANSLKPFKGALRDRMFIIHTKPLNEDDKLAVAQKFTLPRLLKENGYEEKDILFSEELLRYIIQKYTLEAGARMLEQALTDIVEEISLRDTSMPDYKPPFVLDQALVDELLKDPVSREKKVPEEPLVGWVNGLYATKAGKGGVISVEVQRMYGRKMGKIKTTGTVGDMMKESAEVAYTVAFSLLPEEKREEILSGRQYGFLIHHGRIGQPTDGPSSGSAIVTSMVSQLTNIKVRAGVAMTGEIGPSGSVKPIGGLESKLPGAKRHGCRLVLVPKENEEDLKKVLEEMPKLIEPGVFEVKLVENIREVLAIALEENDLFRIGEKQRL